MALTQHLTSQPTAGISASFSAAGYQPDTNRIGKPNVRERQTNDVGTIIFFKMEALFHRNRLLETYLKRVAKSSLMEKKKLSVASSPNVFGGMKFVGQAILRYFLPQATYVILISLGLLYFILFGFVCSKNRWILFFGYLFVIQQIMRSCG